MNQDDDEYATFKFKILVKAMYNKFQTLLKIETEKDSPFSKAGRGDWEWLQMLLNSEFLDGKICMIIQTCILRVS